MPTSRGVKYHAEAYDKPDRPALSVHDRPLTGWESKPAADIPHTNARCALPASCHGHKRSPRQRHPPAFLLRGQWPGYAHRSPDKLS
ncbi:hypothetical protein D3C76_1446900 [compost metagenome]